MEFSSAEKAIARICQFAYDNEWDEGECEEAALALDGIDPDELLAMPDEEFCDLMMIAAM